MARSQETFSKKERQKKKLQKKKEKQLRRDEKRTEEPKAKSFDDMIAYVDENGNISSTSPDPTKIKEIAAEDIDLDNSRQSAADDTPPIGKVSYFDPSKGYGFINNSMTGERLFVHINDAEGPLAEGDEVTYTPTRSPRGMQASAVRKFDRKAEERKAAAQKAEEQKAEESNAAEAQQAENPNAEAQHAENEKSEGGGKTEGDTSE